MIDVRKGVQLESGMRHKHIRTARENADHALMYKRNVR